MTTEIEELLRSEMSAQVQGVHLSPYVFQTALRRHRRHRAVVATISGTAAVTAAAVATAITLASPGTAPARHTASGSQHEQTSRQRTEWETVAYVRRRILQAVDPRHAIVRMTARASDQTNDNWFDQDTGYITDYSYDRAGRLVSATRYPQTRAGTITEVDYRTRTYSVQHQDASPLPHTTEGKLGEPQLDTVADITAAVRRSDVQIVGHDSIQGRPATHLRFTFTRGAETVTGDAWFDSETYVPLRATTSYHADVASQPALPVGADGSAAAPGDGRLSTTTAFLPRTAVNLASTHLVVPAGFTRTGSAPK